MFLGSLVVTLGLRARSASALALKLVRRNIDIAKLVAGIAIVLFGLVILLLGLFAVVASAAEGPLGFHGLLIGGLMVVLGAVFIYLGVRVIADAWNTTSPET